MRPSLSTETAGKAWRAAAFDLQQADIRQAARELLVKHQNIEQLTQSIKAAETHSL